MWTLSWTHPTIDPEDLTPETYDSSLLEYPDCADSLDESDHCFLLAYYPHSDDDSDNLTKRVASTIRDLYEPEHNPEMCIYDENNNDSEYTKCQIIGFSDRDEFNNWMRNTSRQGDRVRGAFSVDESAWYSQLEGTENISDPIEGLQLSYTVYYNNSYDQQTPSNIKNPLAIGTMVHAGLTKALLSDFLNENNYCGNVTDVDFNLQWSFFPQLETYESIIDTIGTGAPIILSLSIAINYAIFSFFIISEKQGKLRQTLYIVGVSDSVFWFSHIIIQVALAFIMGTLCTVCVYMFGFEQSKYTDYWTLATTFTLYYLAGNCFILLMCSILWNVKVAVFFTILIFVAMLIGEMIQVQGIEDYFPGHTNSDGITYDTNAVGRVFLQILWFPTNFSAALAQLGDFTVSKIDSLTSLPVTPPGFYFSDAFHEMHGTGEYGNWKIPMYQQWGFLVLNAVIYCLLGAYLDNIMPFAHGARSNPVFCFYPSYWGVVKQVMPPTASSHYKYNPETARNDENNVYSIEELKEDPYHELPEWDEDVRNEARKLWTPYSERDKEGVGAIEMINLCKTFYHRPPSVLNMNLSIAKNQVFTLLGPNGAGKTTTISMLTGSLTPTSGYASILGHSIKHERTKISPHIGLTPQHDILWPEMTCEEHLIFFARLRGIDPNKELDRLIEEEEAAIKSGIASSSTLSKMKSASNLHSRVGSKNNSRAVSRASSRSSSSLRADLDESLSGSAHSSHTGTGSLSSHQRTSKSNSSRSSRRIYRPGFVLAGQNGYQKQSPLQQLALMRLQDVNLRSSAKLLVSALSGGMRRRLTLAISLLGGPDVVFLDEPTTGLDPVSRRLVWDVITRAKRGHSIVLTTHSMEEADTLSDRIGIMARGILRCLGSSAHLKRLYGLGYRLDLETLYDAERCISNVLRVRNELVMPIIPEARLISKTGGHLTLALPRTISSKQLEDFLIAVESACENQPELVRDWSLRQTTLEEVFLAIVRVAEKQHEMRTRRAQMVGELVKNSS